MSYNKSRSCGSTSKTEFYGTLKGKIAHVLNYVPRYEDAFID